MENIEVSIQLMDIKVPDDVRLRLEKEISKVLEKYGFTYSVDVYQNIS